MELGRWNSTQPQSCSPGTRGALCPVWRIAGDPDFSGSWSAAALPDILLSGTLPELWMLGVAPPLMADREFCLLPKVELWSFPPRAAEPASGAPPSPSPLRDLWQSLALLGGQQQLGVAVPSGILSGTFPELWMLGVAPLLMADREFCLLPGQNSGASPPRAQSQPLELHPAPVLSEISGNPFPHCAGSGSRGATAPSVILSGTLRAPWTPGGISPPMAGRDSPRGLRLLLQAAVSMFTSQRTSATCYC
ncbi:uncharacterized protein [Equus asinus]|uniref:uncharacterized protein n=1 Tax=Equus asinus TaxID=9793 RepID=UPI0038F61A2F